MPPIFIYKKSNNTVTEFETQGMPLGAISESIFKINKFEVETGDAILILSDGLPELKNEKHEQYDYARVKDEFKLAADKTPNDIVEYLKSSASQWANGVEPDDDVTFVVIKVK
jgi:sigma-B regulation protein RsbU (phosphoserine phosphatase)